MLNSVVIVLGNVSDVIRDCCIFSAQQEEKSNRFNIVKASITDSDPEKNPAKITSKELYWHIFILDENTPWPK